MVSHEAELASASFRHLPTAGARVVATPAPPVQMATAASWVVDGLCPSAYALSTEEFALL